MLERIVNVYTRIRDYALALSVLLVLGLGLALYTTGLRLDSCKTGRLADKRAYTLAAEQSKSKALEDKIAKEKQYADSKAKADAQYADLRSKYSAILLRYKGLRPQPQPNLPSPGQGQGSGSIEGISESSLIPISEEDFMICAENTAKAQVAHDWAITLDLGEKNGN